jgi:hypothetical protein
MALPKRLEAARAPETKKPRTMARLCCGSADGSPFRPMSWRFPSVPTLTAIPAKLAGFRYGPSGLDSSASVKHGNRGRTYPVTFPAIDRIGKSLSGAAISLSAMLSDVDD